jgi:lipopolysaccharide export system protein LptA
MKQNRFRSTSPSRLGGLGEAAGAALITALTIGLVNLAQVDSLARYRTPIQPMDAPGITVPNASITVWKEGRRKAELAVGELIFTRDRQVVRLNEGVKARLLAAQPGAEITVDMPAARYNSFERLVTADQGLRVRSKDLDLKAAQFSFDDRSGLLTIPGSTEGTLRKGQVKGVDFTGDTAKSVYALARAAWVGPALIAGLQGQPSRWDLRGDKPVMRGDLFTVENGRAADPELIVKGLKIEWNRKTDVLVATGDVRFFSESANFRANKVTVFRREKRILMEGEAVMLSKPKDQEELKEEPIPAFPVMAPAQATPESQGLAAEGPEREQDEELRKFDSIRDYPLTARADRITYFYQEGARRAEIEGSPQARQAIDAKRWRRLWSQRAAYDREADSLVLYSRAGQLDVRFISSIGDDFRAEQLQLSTKEGDDSWSADRFEGIAFGDPDGDGRRQRA